MERESFSIPKVPLKDYLYVAEKVGNNEYINVEAVDGRTVITARPTWFGNSDLEKSESEEYPAMSKNSENPEIMPEDGENPEKRSDSFQKDIKIIIDPKKFNFLKHISPEEFVDELYRFRKIEQLQNTKQIRLFNCGLTQENDHPGHLCLRNYYWFWCLLGPCFWPCVISIFGTHRGLGGEYRYSMRFLVVSSIMYIFQGNCLKGTLRSDLRF